MRTVLAYPGNMAHAQHTARAIHEAGCLDAYVTSFAWRTDGAAAALIDRTPLRAARALGRQLQRRTIRQIPADLVHAYPFWEIARTLSMKVTRNPVPTDMLWDQSSRRFGAMVARRYVGGADAIQSFEYAALEPFRRAKETGAARILHMPSLDSRQFEEIQRREKALWPELVGEYDAYFDARFARRYARRCEEIELADIVIANSSLTARSHIRAGADPRKVFAVPLGAPPAIESGRVRPGDPAAPLRVLWAGSFSLGKGAHYLMDAWRRLSAGSAARLDIYGQNLLPARVLASGEDGVAFHGSVPQPELFEAYARADVLVFPTLSDGFGMVVAEALAHGLPVITTDQAGAADLLSEGGGLVVPAADPAALADALRWCLDNRGRLSDMRLEALAAARRRQWSDFRRELIQTLRSGLLLAGYSPGYARLP